MKRLMDLSAVIVQGKRETQCMLRYFAIKEGCHWCNYELPLDEEYSLLRDVDTYPCKIIYFKDGTGMSYGRVKNGENPYIIAERYKYVDSSTVTFEGMLDENLQMEVV